MKRIVGKTLSALFLAALLAAGCNDIAGVEAMPDPAGLEQEPGTLTASVQDACDPSMQSCPEDEPDEDECDPSLACCADPDDSQDMCEGTCTDEPTGAYEVESYDEDAGLVYVKVEYCRYCNGVQQDSGPCFWQSDVWGTFGDVLDGVVWPEE